MPVDMTSSSSQIFLTTQEGRNHVLFHFSIKVRSYAKSHKSCPFSLFNQGTLLREEPQIYRIGFFASGHTENDPTFGNRKGTSGIHVAIDNFDMSPHMSLELSLDTCMTVTGNSFSVIHDGKITVGKLGAAKRDLMIDYVKKHAPYLIDNNGHVNLGRFQINKLLGFDDVKEFLFRLIKY